MKIIGTTNYNSTKNTNTIMNYQPSNTSKQSFGMALKENTVNYIERNIDKIVKGVIENKPHLLEYYNFIKNHPINIGYKEVYNLNNPRDSRAEIYFELPVFKDKFASRKLPNNLGDDGVIDLITKSAQFLREYDKAQDATKKIDILRKNINEINNTLAEFKKKFLSGSYTYKENVDELQAMNNVFQNKNSMVKELNAMESIKKAFESALYEY